MTRIALFVLTALLGTSPGALAAEDYDLVLRSGRVIDPETGLDGIRNVGIRGGTIAAVSVEPLDGKRSIDASGLVVAPGFIDLHQHGQSPEGYRLMALDGVTMGLELEIGVPDLAKFVEARRGRTPVHYGASASYLAARLGAWDVKLQPSHLGTEAGILPQSGPATNDAAGPERLARVLARLKSQIETGSLGIGIGLEYAPGTTRHELIEVFRTAAASGSPVFVHARSSGLREPGSGVESVTELVGAAAISGAPLHIVHINSTCMSDALECIAMIAGARERGLDVTTEAYPYTVAMTAINSALFNPGWREKRGLDYDDLEIPETGERLTRERFEELHASPAWRPILIHTNPDEVVDAIMAAPLAMIASDGSLMHPRGAGSYSRVLSRYVRDRQSLTLPEAIRKMSLMPAQRLEALTPEAKRLGRLQAGARADIVVFHAGSVTDRATFRAPTEPSEGVRYLVVDGTVVVDDGKFRDTVFPGQALLARPREQSGHPSGTADMEQFAVRYSGAWSSGDPERVAAFHAEDGSLSINGGTPAVGRAGITEAARSFMTAYPDMIVELDRLEYRDGKYRYHWRFTGTNSGPGGTGRAVRTAGYEEWTIGATGLIASSEGHYDAAEWDRQLGKAP